MCVYWCVCSWQRDWSCLVCLCFAHLGFSEALSITEGRIYICQGGNNIKPILMLTLVCTPIHVVRLHDYICVALNKTTHLTLSNNFAVMVAHECEIGFFRWLLHCHGSRTEWAEQKPTLRITVVHKYFCKRAALNVISRGGAQYLARRKKRGLGAE